MFDPKSIKAVLFDFDDTLIDWSLREASGGGVMEQHIHNVHAFLEQNAHTVPANEQFYTIFYDILVASWTEAKKTWAGVNFESVLVDTLERIGLDSSQIDMTAVLKAYGWQPVPGIRPYPDTHHVLTTLKENGFKLGLITNSMQPMWMRDIELEAYELMPYFDSRLTSGDVGYMKPHVAIYEKALAELSIEPQHAMFVGDRPGNDVAGANDAGMVSVWIDPPHLNLDLNGVQPDFHITQLSELLTILEL